MGIQIYDDVPAWRDCADPSWVWIGWDLEDKTLLYIRENVGIQSPLALTKNDLTSPLPIGLLYLENACAL